MSSTVDLEKEDLARAIRIQRQIAFAAGVFQEDVTVRTLLESVAEGVVIVDDSGTILLVNARAEKMFRYAKGEMIGIPHAHLIPEAFQEIHQEHQARYLQHPVSRPMGRLLDLVAIRRDGSEFPVEISLGSIKTLHGILVIALIDDITIRKQAEEALNQAEELFRIQIGCVKDYALFMLDPEGTILNWNAGAEALKGYLPEEIIGRHFSCLYPEEDLAAGKPGVLLEKAAAEGRAEDQGWRVRRGGDRFWADVIITALRDESGKLRGFSTVARDITERKKAEDALRLSEARFRALYLDNPTMMVTLDNNLTIISANPACVQQLKYHEDELTGRSVLNLFHENDHQGVREKIADCLQNPYQVYHWQFRKVRKDGSILWVEETAQGVYDLNNNPNVLIVCQDVTEREQLLVQLEAVLDGINEAVVISDLEGNITKLNRAALALWEYESPEQMLRPLPKLEDVFEFLDNEGEPLPFQQWPLMRAIRGESFHDCEIHCRRKDSGKSAILSISGSPVHNKAGEAILAVISGRDITYRKQMEKELQQSKELLEQRVAERTAELAATFERLQAETLQRQQAMDELHNKEQMLIQQGRMAAMGEMIGFIAHQWRQPLNSLGLIVQALPICHKQGLLTLEDLETSASKARELIAHMSRTIDDFRNFFKAEKQKVRFSVKEVLERTLVLVQSALKEKHITLDVSLDDETELEGYPNEYSQVILNILVNTIDVLSERNVVEPMITIRGFKENDRCILTIADSAGGIPDDIIEKVFDAYFTTKSPEKGTGLGLYMARTIIEKNMGGSLTVRNSAEGAEFRIEV